MFNQTQGTFVQQTKQSPCSGSGTVLDQLTVPKQKSFGAGKSEGTWRVSFQNWIHKSTFAIGLYLTVVR